MRNTARHDPYEIRSDDAGTPVSSSTGSGVGRERRSGASGPFAALLWTLAAVLVGLNTALSIAGYDIIGSVAGGGAVLCLTVLLVRYLRRRR